MIRTNKKLWLVIGLAAILILGGIYFFLKKAGILADQSKIVTLNQGATFVKGTDLASLDEKQLLSNGRLSIYSYNDPAKPGDRWAVLKPNCNVKSVDDPKAECVTSMSFDSRLGYLVKNSGSTIKINKKSIKNSLAKLPLSEGKHITYWAAGNTKVRYFRKALKFTFSDNVTMNFQESWIDDKLSAHIDVVTASKNRNELITPPVDTVLVGNANGVIKNNTFFLLEVRKNVEVLGMSIDASALSPAQSDPMYDTPLSISINADPAHVTAGSAIGIDMFNDIKTLGLNAVRLINFDKKDSDDLAFASKIHESVPILSGNFYLGGAIPTDRVWDKELLQSSDGKRYFDYSKVVEDMKLYSGYKPDPNGGNFYVKTKPEWEKLKKLIEYAYFRGMVMDRLSAYKDQVKYWQIWNEPDAALSGTRFALPAEALSLMTTGQYKDGENVIAFEDKEVVINEKKYNFRYGVGGIIGDKTKNGLIKQICSDCVVVSAGFYRTNDDNSFFEILRKNNYEASVEINEIHYNLYPQPNMGYTKYWDEFEKVNSILEALCPNDDTNKINPSNHCGKPLWVTEMGSPSDTIYKDSLVNPTFSMKYSREFQADDMVKRFVTLAGKGVNNISWNGYIANPEDCLETLSDGIFVLDSKTASCAHKQKSLYPVTGNNHAPKPSFSTLKTIVSVMKNAISVEALTPIDLKHEKADQLFVYMITKENGKKTVAAWCDPYWNESNQKTGDWIYDQKSCKTNVDLSKWDVLGNVNVTSSTGVTSKALANNIEITKSPVFIEEWAK